MVGTLETRDLHAGVDGKEILRGLTLRVRQGEVHAIMGPNGSGKSTLSNVIMGHPKYKVTQGDVLLDGQSILKLSPDKRAQKGLFLGFQYPVEVDGVSLGSFLRTAYTATHRDEKLNVPQFTKQVKGRLKDLGMDDVFLGRSLNFGFSGGEKKRAEILQMSVLKPKFAILDETDSGLDIDALKTVSANIDHARGPDVGILLITHYSRILKYVRPDVVHVMVDGRVAVQGGPELAQKLEEKGYDWVREAGQGQPAPQEAA
jgi:Fe-S cluster assembly ATP-binding protein